MEQQQQTPPPPAQPLQTQPPAAVAGYNGQPNTLAIVSLASGILSWFALPIIGAVVAVVAGHMAKREIAHTGEQGGALANIGLVLGYLHLVLVLLLALFVVLVLVGTFAAIRAMTSG